MLLMISVSLDGVRQSKARTECRSASRRGSVQLPAFLLEEQTADHGYRPARTRDTHLHVPAEAPYQINARVEAAGQTLRVQNVPIHIQDIHRLPLIGIKPVQAVNGELMRVRVGEVQVHCKRAG